MARALSNDVTPGLLACGEKTNRATSGVTKPLSCIPRSFLVYNYVGGGVVTLRFRLLFPAIFTISEIYLNFGLRVSRDRIA